MKGKVKKVKDSKAVQITLHSQNRRLVFGNYNSAHMPDTIINILNVQTTATHFMVTTAKEDRHHF